MKLWLGSISSEQQTEEELHRVAFRSSQLGREEEAYENVYWVRFVEMVVA